RRCSRSSPPRRARRSCPTSTARWARCACGPATRRRHSGRWRARRPPATAAARPSWPCARCPRWPRPPARPARPTPRAPPPAAARAPAAGAPGRARERGRPAVLADALDEQARLDPDVALERHHEALALRADHGLRPGIRASLEALAALSEPEQAARLLDPAL